MVIMVSLMREETRKSHYRTDFPTRNDKKWLRNIILKKEDEKTVFTSTPPVITKISPTDEEELQD
jgi:succinate dehydrogenase/fumarate reductase flavoprotein subunit